MTRPGIEPGSPGPLANTLLIRPMGNRLIFLQILDSVMWELLFCNIFNQISISTINLIDLLQVCYLLVYWLSSVNWRCPWYNSYRRRMWTRRHEFKSWTWLIAFHIALIPLGKVWIQIFFLQLWVNSRAD